VQENADLQILQVCIFVQENADPQIRELGFRLGLRGKCVSADPHFPAVHPAAGALLQRAQTSPQHCSGGRSSN